MHEKMAQFFAFLRKSVFAHMIFPETDFLGFFIFAFSMQNINFPYILFPLKKKAISFSKNHFFFQTIPEYPSP